MTLTVGGFLQRRKSSAASPLLPFTDVIPEGPAPPLKWAGGKRWLVPRLRAILRNLSFDRLVEPFAGGLAVALGLMPKAALLADSNPHLINFYRWLQRGLDAKRAGVTFENSKLVYYCNRKRFNSLITDGPSDSEESAALFYYLNRTCFNGLCRFNRSGLFNVPFGRYQAISYEHDFREYKAALANYEFQLADFESIVTNGSDVIYADPPYDVQFTSYSAGGFDWTDQQRLAHWLSQQRSPVIASNQATERIVRLYESLAFHVTTVDAPRRISCDGNRDSALEMLATKRL